MQRVWMMSAVIVAAWALSGATPKPPVVDRPIQVEGVEWRARAMVWFKSTDNKARRKEMRPAGKAIKRACRYCHTKDFKDYTDKRLIAQQMMALSVENDVVCADCHSGRETFTELGESAREMWDLALEKKVFCDHCHVKQKKFTELTPDGQAYEKAHPKKKKAK